MRKKQRRVSWADAYETPSLRGSLGGVARLAQAHGVPVSRARAKLQGLLSYTLHKPRRRRFPTLPVVVHGMDDQWVADLVEMQPLKQWNRGMRYLLTVIDVLSKYAWVEPLKSKTGVAVAAAFERLLKRARGRHPVRLQTDAGKEFYNRTFQALMTRRKIHHFSTYGDTKSSVVERFNRTLKERMYRYFTARNTYRYVDALPALVQGYEVTKHRSIGMPPRDVTWANQRQVWQRLYGKRLARRVRPKWKAGDRVRLQKQHRPFEKGYLPGWTEEVFLIDRAVPRPWLPIKSRSGTARPSKAPFTSKTCRRSTCRTTRCFAWRKCCSVDAKRSRCVGKAGAKSTTVGSLSLACPRYDASGGLDARPAGGPVWPNADGPVAQPKDLDGYDGTVGGQVRTQEGKEEEEGQEDQEEATLQEGPASVPGQIARHGQAREERQLGHDLASIGASLPPGRSRVEGLAHTL